MNTNENSAKFAFIVHPTTQNQFEHIVEKISATKSKISGSPRSRLSTNEPWEAFILPIHSTNGVHVECLGLICPFLPVEIVDNPSQALKQISQAIEMATKFGAKLVGLGGFTSIIGNGGADLARESPLPITSGNTYTAHTIVQSISNACELLGTSLNATRVAIIGATGDIGSACAKKLSTFCRELVLVARKGKGLEQLQEKLSEYCKIVEIDTKPGRAAASAQIVITVTSAYTTLIESGDLQEGTIVCDASYPPNVSTELRKIRKDILIFEGGIAAFPGLTDQIPTDSIFWEFNPRVGVHGCFAESLLLAFAGRWESFSIGRGNISITRMNEIGKLGQRYGFSPSPYWHGSSIYSASDLSAVGHAISEARRTRAPLNDY